MNHSNHTDKKLLEELKDNSEAAFSELYQRYHQGIYAYLLNYVKLPPLAEDLVHEVFLKLWEARQRINVSGTAIAYLHGISRNLALDTLKHLSKNTQLQQELIEWMHPSFMELESDNKESAFLEELFRKAVSDLPPQRRKIFILCKLNGKTYREAAHELGISHSTVKEHIAESLLFLRRQLAGINQSLLFIGIFLYSLKNFF
ncbi:RNA polymerase sigma-70 factor [Flavihumibacter sp. CACIAM 22H1]|uniref:RNA polymerase sigma factor n=1 Tax=Flavihumibacter sp. CACIAM 22H1 TaxID=1812911 RepID=UPI000AD21F11|nr:RNA polymerase sigma-70 factor [Flavihumibacter sp. CACIAM 22H1]